MNRQDNKKGRGIEWTAPPGYQGWTANPIKGCQHACAWRMPNDERAQCYAKSIAEGLAAHAYPQGFNHLQFDDGELQAILRHKVPSGIFVDSMSDLLGLGVPNDWIERVLEVMRLKSEHIFFVLTKNPRRLPDFEWPRNVWLGVSAPPTYMHKSLRMGFDLTKSEDRMSWYYQAIQLLAMTNAEIKWTSIEPLSDDFSSVIQDFRSYLNWAVIGAASNGRETIQPNDRDFANVLNVLDTHNIPVFYKGNLSKSLTSRFGGARHGQWREDFPYYEPADMLPKLAETKKDPQKPQQLSMF